MVLLLLTLFTITIVDLRTINQSQGINYQWYKCIRLKTTK